MNTWTRPVVRLAAFVVCLTALGACTNAEDRKQEHMTRGETLFAEGDYEKARLEFKNVLQIDASDVPARFALAETLEKLQDWQRAAANYAAIVRDHPDHAQAHLRLGTIYGELVATGTRANRSWETRTELAVGAARAGVNRLWARRKIASIMDLLARGVPEDHVRPQAVELALAHNLVSRYTSLVAVDVTPARPTDEKMRTGAVPTNLPSGWKYDKVFGTLPKGGTPSRLYLLTAFLPVE